MTWTIKRKHKKSWWRFFYLLATKHEDGFDYQLIAEFSRPINRIVITKHSDAGDSTEVLSMLLWADTDMNSLTSKIMNATSANVDAQAARIQRIHDHKTEKPI